VRSGNHFVMGAFGVVVGVHAKARELGRACFAVYALLMAKFAAALGCAPWVVARGFG